MTFLIRTTKGYRRDYDPLRRRGFQMSSLTRPSASCRRMAGSLPGIMTIPSRGIWRDSGSAISQGIGSVYMIRGDSLVLTLSRTGRHDDIFR